ncbi:hypothetical protein C0995_005982 [Termitomyces sp. Mi166|nr:hypothetical protein C0995_005982 [Termitomyces sp. Mi166\
MVHFGHSSASGLVAPSIRSGQSYLKAMAAFKVYISMIPAESILNVRSLGLGLEMPTPNVPRIQVSFDNDDSSYCSPSENNLLSLSRSLTHTTAVESNERTSLTIPSLSPTLSSRSSVHSGYSGHSVHFVTPKDLRNNDSERESGPSRPSSAASGTTIPDDSREQSDFDHETLRVDSTTPDVSISNFRKENKKKVGISEADEQTVHQRELEQDRNFDPYPFSYKPFQLAHLVDPPRVFEAMEYFGGTKALLKGLGTDGERGLSKEALSRNSGALAYQAVKDKEQKDREKAEKKNKRKWIWGMGAGQGVSSRHETEEEGKGTKQEERRTPISEPRPDVLYASVDERRRVYGPNLLPKRLPKPLLSLMWLALNDKVLILLSIAAVISLVLGLFQDFGTIRPEDELPVDWVEGVAILVAITLIVIVDSLNDWQNERQFNQLNDKKEERDVKVIRNGVECVIDSKEVVVGDIALLELGEVIPCDGIFLSGHQVQCDETGATGESGAMRKLTYEECMECVERGLQTHPGTTPLQSKLNTLAELIAKLGLFASFALFSALSIRFFVQLGRDSPVRTPIEKGITFINIFMICVALVAVIVPKGLPLVEAIAFGFATKSMARENILVRDLGSLETMAAASAICTDKTGVLTQNVMTVVAGSIGIHAKFVRDPDKHPNHHNADGRVNDRSLPTRKDDKDFSIDQSQLNSVLTPALRELVNEAIAVNSVAFEDKDPETVESFVGNKTDAALLQFAREMGWSGSKETRDAAHVVKMVPFSSERRAMAVVVRLPHNTGFRVYVKGAAEILLKNCTNHIVVRPTTLPRHREECNEVETKAIGTLEENVSETIRFYARQGLRTIALCYRDFKQRPSTADMENDVIFTVLTQDLTLIGIIGIEDPLRPGVWEAVSKCRRAGVTTTMCTGDNIETARTVGRQCGILTSGGNIKEGSAVMETGLRFTSNLQVLARSSPEDKEALINALKSTGAIVCMAGDSALKEADVGFSMGISGTEVAKTKSDMGLTDDSFVSVCKAIMWGRCVNDAVRKCLQFQVTACIVVAIITFVSAVTNPQGLSILSPVQLLWTNIILDTFAVLALVTDPPLESLLDRQPDEKTTPLFTTDMYKQILFQSIYQIFIILVLHFLGLRILHLKLTGDTHIDTQTDLIVQTLVFNIFVFAQIFNLANCRRVDKNLNIFEGILKNKWFLAIIIIEISLQIGIIFVAKDAFKVTKIEGREWGISLGLGVIPMPLGTLIRLLPNEPAEKVLKKLGLLNWPEVLPTVNAERKASSNNANVVKQNLGTFISVRGRRTRSSSR